MARCALAHRGDPGSLCRLKSGGAGRWEHGIAPKAPARGRRLLIGGRNLVDAFRRHAGDEVTVPGRLPRLSHAAVVPGVRSRGGRRGVRGQRRSADRRPACHGRDRDGRWNRIDALRRNERAARKRSLAARGFLRHCEHRHRDRRVRSCALARGRTWRSPAFAALGDRARCRDLRHALHRDGRLDRALGWAPADQRARALERSARHRGRHRRLPRFRHLPADSDTGTLHGQRHGAGAAVVRPGPSGSHSVAGGELDITPDRRTGARAPMVRSAMRAARRAASLSSSRSSATGSHIM